MMEHPIDRPMRHEHAWDAVFHTFISVDPTTALTHETQLVAITCDACQEVRPVNKPTL